MILVYTGNGKGKTSACVGQTVRALGQELRVFFVQFMKRDEKAGEQRMLQQLLGHNLHIGGLGFFRNEAQRPPHREAALHTLALVRAKLGDASASAAAPAAASAYVAAAPAAASAPAAPGSTPADAAASAPAAPAAAASAPAAPAAAANKIADATASTANEIDDSANKIDHTAPTNPACIDMLVLDESLYALQAGLLERAEVESLLDLAEAQGVHVVLSGRGAPDWLCARAHLVTSMEEVKHPWQQGIKATRGIEF